MDAASLVPAARRLKSSPEVSAAERAFVDCEAAIDWARQKGVSERTRFLTTAPGLFGRSGVEVVDANIDASAIRQFVQNYVEASHVVARTLDSIAAWRDESHAVTRAFLQFMSAAYKAFILRPEHLDRPFVIVSLELGKGRLNMPWLEILDRHPNLVGSMQVPAAACPVMPDIPYDYPNVWTRLRFEDWQSVAYRVLQRINARARFGWRGTILVSAENSLTKETALHLMLRGYNIELIERRPSVTPAPVGGDELSILANALSPIFERLFGRLLIPEVSELMSPALLRHIRQFIGKRRATTSFVAEQINNMKLRKPLALLSNHAVGAEAEGVEAGAQAGGLPVVTLQHGTGVEFCSTHDGILPEEEIVTCDLSLVYSDSAAAAAERNPYRRGQAAVVGPPRDLAFIGRKKPTGRDLPPIIFCSNQALMGNVHRPVICGVTDIAAVRWEIELIERVFEHIPHRVLFKPYPTYRYADPLPSVTRARMAQNVELFERRIDLRYLIGDSRILISSLGHSTITWCVMSGKPTIFLEQPDQNPLRPDARDLFRNALFYIDCGARDWHAQLRSLLSRPLAELETMYADKAAARKVFIERYIGTTDGNAGARAARTVLKEIGRA